MDQFPNQRTSNRTNSAAESESRRLSLAFLIPFVGAVTATLTGTSQCRAQPDARGLRYDGSLSRCTTEWHQRILRSDRFGLYLEDRLDITALPAGDAAELALAEALLPPRNHRRVWNTVLLSSNPYSAAALYASVRAVPNPDNCHYYLARMCEKFPTGSAPEFDAALFAHIMDEESFEEAETREPIIFIKIEYLREKNMYSAFAERLLARNQAYMYREWLRLRDFRNNRMAPIAAEAALESVKDCEEAATFSKLVEDIRALYRRGACKRFVVFQRSLRELPGPYEHLTVGIGDVTGGKVPMSVVDAGRELGSLRRGSKGDVVQLPVSTEGDYLLIVERVWDNPLGKDVVALALMPRCIWEYHGERVPKGGF